MDAKVVVKQVTPVQRKTGVFEFHVSLECDRRSFTIQVMAGELLDFDQFQTAVLRQTGCLVMPPCHAGHEGPDFYRRARGNWCRELRGAVWREPMLLAPEAGQTNAVPPPKGLHRSPRSKPSQFT